MIKSRKSEKIKCMEPSENKKASDVRKVTLKTMRCSRSPEIQQSLRTVDRKKRTPIKYQKRAVETTKTKMSMEKKTPQA
jgi:hypothetical protein